jgi:hypothetical protein
VAAPRPSSYKVIHDVSSRVSCDWPECKETFTRAADLDRHRNSVHQPEKQFWCTVLGCDRSQSFSGLHRPFPRKDKRDSHVRKVHGAVVSSSTLPAAGTPVGGFASVAGSANFNGSFAVNGFSNANGLTDTSGHTGADGFASANGPANIDGLASIGIGGLTGLDEFTGINEFPGNGIAELNNIGEVISVGGFINADGFSSIDGYVNNNYVNNGYVKRVCQL